MTDLAAGSRPKVRSSVSLVRRDTDLADVVIDLRMSGRKYRVPTVVPAWARERVVDGVRLRGWVESPGGDGCWVNVVRWEVESSGATGAFLSSTTAAGQPGLMPKHIKHLLRPAQGLTQVAIRAHAGLERTLVSHLPLVTRMAVSGALGVPVVNAVADSWLPPAAYRVAWACAGVEDVDVLPQTLDVLVEGSWAQYRGQTPGSVTMRGVQVAARAQAAGFEDVDAIGVWAPAWFIDHQAAQKSPTAVSGERSRWELAHDWHRRGWDPFKAAAWHKMRYPSSSDGGVMRHLTARTVEMAAEVGMTPALVDRVAQSLPGQASAHLIEVAVDRWASLNLPPEAVAWHLVAGMNGEEARSLAHKGEIPDVEASRMLAALRDPSAATTVEMMLRP